MDLDAYNDESLLAERDKRLDSARAIKAKAELEKRDVTPQERRDFDAAMAEAAAFKTELERRAEPGPGRQTSLADCRADESGTSEDRAVSGSPHELRFLKSTECLTSVYRSERDKEFRDFSLGKYIKGFVLGEWDGAELEKRALSSSLDASGSITVPVAVSRNIWDRTRNQAVIFRAGATTIVMPGPKLIVPKLTTDATGFWKPENAEATKTSMTWAGMELQARTLFFWMECSQELWDDAGLLEDQIRNSFAEAAALTIDYAALLGTGEGETPQGLYYNSDVTQTAVAANGYDDISDAIYRIENENGAARTVVHSPRSANYYRKQKDGEGQFIPLPDWFPEKFVTKQIPDNLGAGTDESISITGDFRNMLIGIRSPFTIGLTKEGTAAKKKQVWIYGAMRADVAIMRPEHFDITTGIKTGWTA